MAWLLLFLVRGIGVVYSKYAIADVIARLRLVVLVAWYGGPMRLLIAAFVLAFAVVTACGGKDPNAWSPERGCQDAKDAVACSHSCPALKAALDWLDRHQGITQSEKLANSWLLESYLTEAQGKGCSWAQ